MAHISYIWIMKSTTKSNRVVAYPNPRYVDKIKADATGKNLTNSKVISLIIKQHYDAKEGKNK